MVKIFCYYKSFLLKKYKKYFVFIYFFKQYCINLLFYTNAYKMGGGNGFLANKIYYLHLKYIKFNKIAYSVFTNNIKSIFTFF